MVLVHPLKLSSYLGKCTEQFAKEGKLNCSNQICHVERLETTVGCGSTLMGVLSRGVSVSVLCSSSSIVEMIPKLHLLTSQTWRNKLRDSHASCVIHVSAFGFDNDLSLLSDYSDIMYASQTGVAEIHSHNVQECHDISLISYLAASRVHLPFLHFFDGIRTGNEISKVNQMSFDRLAKLKMLYSDDKKKSSVVEDYFTWKLVPSKKIPDIVDDIMSKMARVLKRRYYLFDYVGSGSAEHVIISLSPQNETTILSNVIKKEGRRVGLVIVRMLRPWSSKHFLKMLPRSVTKCIVVSSVSSRALAMLLADVSTSIQHSRQSCQVLSAQFQNVNSFGYNTNAVLSLLQRLDELDCQTNITIDCAKLDQVSQNKTPNDFHKILVWNCISDGEAIVNAGMNAITLLGDYSGNFVHGFQLTDCYQPGSGTAISFLHFNETFFPPPTMDSNPHCVVCNNTTILNQFNVVGELDNGGILVLNSSATTAEELEEIVPTKLKSDIAQRELKLYAINAVGWLKKLELEQQYLQLFFQVIIFRFSGLCNSIEQVSKLLKENLIFDIILNQYNLPEDNFFAMVNDALQSVVLIEVPETWIDAQDMEAVIDTNEKEEEKEEKEEEEEEEEKEETQLVPVALVELPTILTPSLISYSKKDEMEKYSSGGWYKAVLPFMFPDAYDCQSVQRPFEHEETYVVRVSLRKRLTPNTYERDVFHIEFDTTESDMTYEIGDALGIFPHNIPALVTDFLSYYDLDPTQSVSVNIHGRTEIRTIEQVFTQVLDLFGRPGRRFYESFSKFAQDPKEKAKLEFLGSAEGGPAFKKRVDDTITYANLLQEFPSCKLTVIQMMEIIPPIKPRHYSIASAMSKHPNSVHLLVVLVEWKQPSTGKQRFGLCSKYLDDLKVGDAVTVCVKPSMMKLPEDPAAPIIMAGLALVWHLSVRLSKNGLCCIIMV